MAIQVVVGRAGTGKTALCLDAIRGRLRAQGEDGPPLIFLVPEQAAFQMERALIETPDVPGTARCHVLSFTRLARRVLNEVGAGNRRPLSELGRLMAVEWLLRRLEPQLEVLPARSDGGGSGAGLLTALAGALVEWTQEDLDPRRLAELAEAADRERGDVLAAGRLRDLHRLYTAYREFMAAGRIDPAMELAVAEGLLDRVAWLRGAEVWVDGFAGFTALERRMLVRLTSAAQSVVVTLLMEPGADILDRTDVPVSAYSLFSRAERTYDALRDAMREAGVTWRPPERLRVEHPPRFASPGLARLERALFRPMRDAEPAANAAQARADVRVVVPSNRRVEVDAAIAEVQRLVRESRGAVRYRDVAIIVRDLEPYHDLLSAALDAAKVPYFIDRRRATAHHALVDLLRVLPALARGPRAMSADSVRLLLKTGLAPLADDEADALENYVLAHGIEGMAAWLAPADWSYRRLFGDREDGEPLSEPAQAELARINTYRRRLVEPLRPWLDLVAGAAAGGAPFATGRQWAEALWATLDAMHAGETVARWADEAADDGHADDADLHRQVWRDGVALLDDLADALGDTELTVGELAAVLEAALGAFTLGLAPPTLDQVLVGSIERSRHPELAAVLLLGVADGQFPHTAREDALLNDAERESLARRGCLAGTSRRQRILDEKMLAYIACTRPSRSLWISCPRADETGRPLRLSPYVADVLAALPGVRVEPIEDPVAARAAWPIGRPRELAARLAVELRARPESPDDDDREVRGAWNALYMMAQADAALSREAQAALSSLAYRNGPVLSASVAERLLGAVVFSASRIETFAACPFQHFASYALKLEPRVEFEIKAIDFGRLHHKILEVFFEELIRERRRLDELDPSDIHDRLARISSAWTERLTDEALLVDARNQFLLSRSGRPLEAAVRRLRLMARLGSLRPAAVEWTFGFGRRDGARATDSPEPLEITTPKGRTIRLRGKVDRVDVFEAAEECVGLVLDYKRSAGRAMPLWKVYAGLELQILTYLLALAQRGRTPAGRAIRPIGGLYVPLMAPRESVRHPQDATTADRVPSGVKARGLMSANDLSQIDGELEAGGASAAYGVALKKDGGVARPETSDAIDADALDLVLRFARRRIGELADGIIDGDVAVRPYRVGTQMPCSFCEYRAVCRFDHDTDDAVEIARSKRGDVLDRMAAEIKGSTP